MIDANIARAAVEAALATREAEFQRGLMFGIGILALSLFAQVVMHLYYSKPVPKPAEPVRPAANASSNQGWMI